MSWMFWAALGLGIALFCISLHIGTTPVPYDKWPMWQMWANRAFVASVASFVASVAIFCLYLEGWIN
jgi:hypothetical protein